MSLSVRTAVIALCGAALVSGTGAAQAPRLVREPQFPQRQYGGWNAVTTATPAGAGQVSLAAASAAAAEPPAGPQRAFYQTQGDFSNSLPVMPPDNFQSSRGASGAASQQLPAIPSLGAAGVGSASTLPAGGTQGLRAIDPVQPPPAGPVSPGGRYAPQEFTSGLPHVTPAPRTGRYPTSPYAGPRFQQANYQLRTLPAQTVSTSSGGLSVPNALAAAAQQPVLPQYQNGAGVYPTAYQQCAPAPSFPATGAVPGTFVPPTFTPNLTPGLYSPTNSGYAPLVSLGQENYNVLLGRGIIGQPTVYVPGQHFRNFFRYISP